MRIPMKVASPTIRFGLSLSSHAVGLSPSVAIVHSSPLEIHQRAYGLPPAFHCGTKSLFTSQVSGLIMELIAPSR